jgi:peptidoglycan/LPS O-acetylase OafA/YrhL
MVSIAKADAWTAADAVASPRSAPRNNFNLLRLIAATLVIVSHGFVMRRYHGYYHEDDLSDVAVLGWIAVNMFFVMSGFLIANSIAKNADIRRYITNRALRIYPGLLACTVITILLVGVLFRPKAFLSYIVDPSTLQFFIGNVSAVWIQYDLPHIFATNAYAGVVNGSLWSLQFEVGCYLIVVGLLAVGALDTARRRAALIVILLTLYATGGLLMAAGCFPHSTTLNKMHRLGFCFALGGAYACAGEAVRVRAWHIACAGAVLALSYFTPLDVVRDTAASVTIALATFWAARLDWPLLVRLRGLPDWSYGVYIYAWPIQQLLLYFAPGLTIAEHIAAAVLLTLPVAACSWNLVEKPALALKRRPSAA